MNKGFQSDKTHEATILNTKNPPIPVSTHKNAIITDMMQ